MSLVETKFRELPLIHFNRLATAWLERAIQRRDLAQLDGRLLRDLGLTRREAKAESAKWFWQA